TRTRRLSVGIRSGGIGRLLVGCDEGVSHSRIGGLLVGRNSRGIIIAAVAIVSVQMDAFVRRYIHENLSYRFVMLSNGAAAYAVEAAIKNGEWEHGRPLLNPGG